MADEIKMTVPDMIRQTANNSSEFMKQIAEHIEKLEAMVADLTVRITELEGGLNGNDNSSQ
jgi:predicted metal-dependent RNase